MKTTTTKKPPMSPRQLDDHGDAKIERIDAAAAKAYLENNHPDNRRVDPNIVASYTRDMRGGRWLMLGDPIRFDMQGRLIDGQHRLRSVVATGIPQTFIVLRNIPDDAIFQIDTGKTRTPGDMLRIAGYRNALLRAGALRWMHQLRGGLIHGDFSTEARTGDKVPRVVRLNRAELLELAERHPLLGESLGKFNPVRGISPSMVSAIHYVGSVLLDRREAADSFVNVLNTGIPAYEGDPVHTLRERLIREDSMRVRLLPTSQFAALVHVWNHHKKQSSTKVLRFPTTVRVDGLDPYLI